MTKTKQVHLRIDASVIAALDDPYDILEPVFNLVVLDDPSAYEASLRRFSRAQRLIFGSLLYDGQVCNGGHSQFFGNSTGMVWPDALEGFQTIGLPEISAIVRESVGRFIGLPDLDHQRRRRQLESPTCDFADLDTRYYDVLERIDLKAKVIDYIRSTPSEFTFEGIVKRLALVHRSFH